MTDAPLLSLDGSTVQKWLAACGLLRLLAGEAGWEDTRLHWSRGRRLGPTPTLVCPADTDPARLPDVVCDLARRRADAPAWGWLDAGADREAWAAVPDAAWRDAAGAWEWVTTADSVTARGGRNPLVSPEGQARPSNVGPKACRAVADIDLGGWFGGEAELVRLSPLGLDPLAATPAALTDGRPRTATDPVAAWLALEALPLFPCRPGGEPIPTEGAAPKKRGRKPKGDDGAGATAAPAKVLDGYATNALMTERPPSEHGWPKPVECRLPVWGASLRAADVAELVAMAAIHADPDAAVVHLPRYATATAYTARGALTACGVWAVLSARRAYDPTRQSWKWGAAEVLWEDGR